MYIRTYLKLEAECTYVQYICTVHVMCIIVILCKSCLGDGLYIGMLALLELYLP